MGSGLGTADLLLRAQKAHKISDLQSTTRNCIIKPKFLKRIGKNLKIVAAETVPTVTNPCVGSNMLTSCDFKPVPIVPIAGPFGSFLGCLHVKERPPYVPDCSPNEEGCCKYRYGTDEFYNPTEEDKSRMVPGKCDECKEMELSGPQTWNKELVVVRRLEQNENAESEGIRQGWVLVDGPGVLSRPDEQDEQDKALKCA